MNFFVYDEHTPARAKKQAGRELFSGFPPANIESVQKAPGTIAGFGG
jgi:hypothetical protein